MDDIAVASRKYIAASSDVDNLQVQVEAQKAVILRDKTQLDYLQDQLNVAKVALANELISLKEVLKR